MDIAYIISAYKNPEQLIRLIHRLNCDTTTFYVHVDKKTGREVFDQIAHGLQLLPNVYLLKRFPCYWGGFGHVQATLEGINELIKRGSSFGYCILLTGQDYPIKRNDQIQDYLFRSNGKSFLNHFPLPTDQWEGGGLQRVEQWHVRIFGTHYVFPKNKDFFIKRRFPRGFRPFGGSSYWCLSKECIDYLHKFIQRNPKFVDFFKYVDVPDEIFFQTILLNSPFAGRIVNDDLRYIEWKEPDSGSPSVLGKDDLRGMINSAKLFARKFDVTIDAEVLKLIDQEILAVR